jgi:hypothetical protein
MYRSFAFLLNNLKFDKTAEAQKGTFWGPFCAHSLTPAAFAVSIQMVPISQSKKGYDGVRIRRKYKRQPSHSRSSKPTSSTVT